MAIVGQTLALSAVAPDGSAHTPTVTVTLPDGTTVNPGVPTQAGSAWTVPYVTAHIGRHVYSYLQGSNAPLWAWSDVFEVDATLNGLVSLADVKAQLAVPASSTTYDSQLIDFIEASTTVIEFLAGIQIPRTVTVSIVANGNGSLMTAYMPITAVATVLDVNGSAVDLTDLRTDGFAAGVIYLPGLSPGAPYAVTYTAGPATVDATLRLAAMFIVQHLWESRRASSAKTPGPGSTETVFIAGYSIPKRAVDMIRNSGGAVMGFG